MTIPQIEFVDCNYDEMMKQFSSNASNILPYRNPVVFPPLRVHQHARGKMIDQMQETLYYDGNMQVSAWIVRLFFDDGTTLDYPMIFQVGNTVYILSDYSFL